jgi:hypothetical protein
MATDQEIRDAGFKYIPQQKYLLNPFEIPTPPTVNQPPPGQTGIFATDAGDNFSVYNADPNTITNMNPNRYALQDARYDNELSYVGSPVTGYTTDTAAMKHMGMYPEYYGLDKPPPSKISQLISKGIGFIPGIGTLSKFADFATGLLPVNRRAIMENQLGTQGVMVNDIGQIVVGPGGQYNTPEGIMAGYNVAKMTDKTFDKRTKNISETLKEKYGLTQDQVDGLISGELTEEDFTGSQYNLKGTNKQTNLITNLINIQRAKKNFQDVTDTTDQIVNIKTDTKDQQSGGGDGTFIGGGASLQDAGGTYDGGYHGAEGGFENTTSSPGTSDQGYTDSGAYAGLKYGGLVSIL